MKKEIILSGIQPSGRLHIGNYLGALKNFVKLQNEHECFFFIADYHSITQDYDPKQKQDQIFELVSDFLAAGLDPKKCTIFVQSHIPAHTELAWAFNCITPMSFLERMTQYKDKASRQEKNINVGLFTYPILQAADILIYKSTAVPVGQDQDQHVELTRQVARFFNNRFGQTFVEPKTIHTEVPKIMSLLQPDKKMSKSLGDNHCIYLDDSPEVIENKIKKAVTNRDARINVSPKTNSIKEMMLADKHFDGVNNLLRLLYIFSEEKGEERFKYYTEKMKNNTIQYSELKVELSKTIAKYFSDFRKKKEKISKKDVQKVLDDGAKKASKIANQTLEEVREKIGVR